MGTQKSVSGVRGIAGKSLVPETVSPFVAAFVSILRDQRAGGANGSREKISVVVGRDSRVSGPWVESQVVATLLASGCDVIRIGIAPTPTVSLSSDQRSTDQSRSTIIVLFQLWLTI